MATQEQLESIRFLAKAIGKTGIEVCDDYGFGPVSPASLSYRQAEELIWDLEGGDYNDLVEKRRLARKAAELREKEERLAENLNGLAGKTVSHKFGYKAIVVADHGRTLTVVKRGSKKQMVIGRADVEIEE